MGTKRAKARAWWCIEWKYDNGDWGEAITAVDVGFQLRAFSTRADARTEAKRSASIWGKGQVRVVKVTLRRLGVAR